MKKTTAKSFEEKIVFEEKEYLVKVSILSVSEDAEFENIDKEENEGFIYYINISSEPALPIELIDTSNRLIFVLLNGGECRLGYLQNSTLIDLEESLFVTGLQASIIEVLAIVGDTGNFKVPQRRHYKDMQ